MNGYHRCLTTLFTVFGLMANLANANHLNPPDVIGNPGAGRECSVDIGDIATGPPDPGVPGHSLLSLMITILAIRSLIFPISTTQWNLGLAIPTRWNSIAGRFPLSLSCTGCMHPVSTR